jgi:hypothetical protein
VSAIDGDRDRISTMSDSMDDLRCCSSPGDTMISDAGLNGLDRPDESTAVVSMLVDAPKRSKRFAFSRDPASFRSNNRSSLPVGRDRPVVLDASIGELHTELRRSTPGRQKLERRFGN